MANQALLEKLRKSSTIKMAEVVSESAFFNDKDSIPFSIPMLNVAFSGDPDVGFVPGLTTWAGPSKHFKTMFSLLQAKAYMDKYPDAILLFYDSEFGTPKAYFQSLGIDMSRVFHTPVTDVEQLKFDIMNQLQNIQRGDRVFILVDSVGNLASKKEVEDALAEKSTADMTRAKQLKSLGRMVTPHLTIKNIPMTVVNHTYKCGTADMEVLMADGTTKNLNKVVVGDVVMTEVGPEPVLWTTSHEDAWVTDIELEDGRILSFTGQHRFKVNGDWKFVEDMRPGDELDWADLTLSTKPKIKSVKFACRKADVFDFETPSHSYLLKDGIISHNTMEIFSKDVVGGGCVVAGTRIILADGSTKAVEEFAVGDVVATLEGPQVVTAVWNPDTLDEGTPDCYEITFEDGFSVTCSAAHRFIVDGEWVEAKDLRVGQESVVY